jgi:2-keto-4-pentenoate hydratase
MNNSLARQLWQARLDGALIDVADEGRPADEDQAYAVQAAIIELAPVDIAGFKIGATSEAAIQALGVEGPFFGPMFDRFCHDTGTEIALSSEHQPALETEFAIGLADDLPGRDAPYSQEEVAAAAAWVAPAFEIAGPRFSAPIKGNGNLIIADCGINMAFICGPRTTDLSTVDLGEHPATLILNGEQVTSGHSGMSVLDNPLGAVAWLASHPRMRERGLRAGDILSTGTCTGLTSVSAGDVADADFGALGKVSVKFVGR